MTGGVAEAALDYGRHGWAVLPLRGKIPHTEHGLKDASTDLDQIAAWWRRWPSANVGVAPPSTVVVIDVDPRHGGDLTLADWTARHGPLPATMTAISGRGDGGAHYYLQHPGGPLTHRLLDGTGVDLREGGKSYLVGPPSRHPDTGGTYRWGDLAPVAECPGWLAGLIRRPAPAPRRRDDQDATAPASALVTFVQGLQEGGRNAGLYWAACRAVDDDTLDRIEPQLIDAALGVGLPLAEINTVIRSARGGR